MQVKNWHRELSRFVSKNIDGEDRVRTWSRPNKRYGFAEAGTKCGPSKKLIIGVDTSGSMSEEEINQALAEAISMLRCGIDAEVWLFDTVIHNKVKLKKGMKISKCGRGGSDYRDLMQQAQKARPDGLIIITDGDCDLPSNPRMPLLWVLTAGERGHLSYGRTVVLDK
jgi:predicted metal-dependent peptidase